MTSVRDPLPRRMYNVDISDQNELIDKGMVVFFQGPKSSTGEDVMEFHMHGGLAVVEKMLGCLSRFENVCLAEPGEFTRRAFDNGKMDLSQVEGLSDLVSAETESQRKIALSQFQVNDIYKGTFGGRL